LLALAAGLPIVNPSWLDACHQSGLLIRVAEGHIARATTGGARVSATHLALSAAAPAACRPQRLFALVPL